MSLSSPWGTYLGFFHDLNKKHVVFHRVDDDEDISEVGGNDSSSVIPRVLRPHDVHFIVSQVTKLWPTRGKSINKSDMQTNKILSTLVRNIMRAAHQGKNNHRELFSQCICTEKWILIKTLQKHPEHQQIGLSLANLYVFFMINNNSRNK